MLGSINIQTYKIAFLDLAPKIKLHKRLIPYK
jgi:hypothetical protein